MQAHKSPKWTFHPKSRLAKTSSSLWVLTLGALSQCQDFAQDDNTIITDSGGTDQNGGSGQNGGTDQNGGSGQNGGTDQNGGTGEADNIDQPVSALAAGDNIWERQGGLFLTHVITEPADPDTVDLGTVETEFFLRFILSDPNDAQTLDEQISDFQHAISLHLTASITDQDQTGSSASGGKVNFMERSDAITARTPVPGFPLVKDYDVKFSMNIAQDGTRSHLHNVFGETQINFSSEKITTPVRVFFQNTTVEIRSNTYTGSWTELWLLFDESGPSAQLQPTQTSQAVILASTNSFRLNVIFEDGGYGFASDFLTGDISALAGAFTLVATDNSYSMQPTQIAAVGIYNQLHRNVELTFVMDNAQDNQSKTYQLQLSAPKSGFPFVDHYGNVIAGATASGTAPDEQLTFVFDGDVTFAVPETDTPTVQSENQTIATTGGVIYVTVSDADSGVDTASITQEDFSLAGANAPGIEGIEFFIQDENVNTVILALTLGAGANVGTYSLSLTDTAGGIRDNNGNTLQSAAAVSTQAGDSSEITVAAPVTTRGSISTSTYWSHKGKMLDHLSVTITAPDQKLYNLGAFVNESFVLRPLWGGTDVPIQFKSQSGTAPAQTWKIDLIAAVADNQTDLDRLQPYQLVVAKEVSTSDGTVDLPVGTLIGEPVVVAPHPVVLEPKFNVRIVGTDGEGNVLLKHGRNRSELFNPELVQKDMSDPTTADTSYELLLPSEESFKFLVKTPVPDSELEKFEQLSVQVRYKPLDDMDGDGVAELVNIQRSEDVFVIRFSATMHTMTITSPGRGHENVTSEDLDGDGLADLILQEHVIYGSSTLLQMHQHIILTPSSGDLDGVRSLVDADGVVLNITEFGDIDADGSQDFGVAFGNPQKTYIMRGAELQALLSDADLTTYASYFAQQSLPQLQGTKTLQAAGDVNGDGLVDLLAVSEQGTFAVIYGNREYTKTGSTHVLFDSTDALIVNGVTFKDLPDEAGGFSPFLAISDSNGDGYDDIFVGRFLAYGTATGFDYLATGDGVSDNNVDFDAIFSGVDQKFLKDMQYYDLS